MSGLIFSLLLGPVSTASLMRVLKDGLEFREIAEGRGLRGYVEEDGYRIEVFAKRDKKQVQFMLPDLSIPDDVCKKAVKKLTSKLYALIAEKDISPDNITVVGPSFSFCHYCLEHVMELLFKCWRCGGLYCNRHRFPEQHNCPGSGLERVGLRVKMKKKEKAAAPAKVLLREAPCG